MLTLRKKKQDVIIFQAAREARARLGRRNNSVYYTSAVVNSGGLGETFPLRNVGPPRLGSVNQNSVAYPVGNLRAESESARESCMAHGEKKGRNRRTMQFNDLHTVKSGFETS